MPNESNNVIKFRYKYIVIFLIVLLVGLFLLLNSYNIPKAEDSFRKLLFEHLATAMIVASLTGILYEYFLRLEFLKSTAEQTDILLRSIKRLGEEAIQRASKITEHFAGHIEQRELGLSHCFKEVDRFDFADIIEESADLTIVLNDGRTWVSSYFQRFKNRFADINKKTTFILMHPESSAIKLHANKVGGDAISIQMKIAETIREIDKAKANNVNANVNILGHNLYNTLSIFLADNNAIVTPYFVSKVRQTPPILVFYQAGPACFYSKLKADVSALLSDSIDISTYKFNSHNNGRIQPVEQQRQPVAE